MDNREREVIVIEDLVHLYDLDLKEYGGNKIYQRLAWESVASKKGKLILECVEEKDVDTDLEKGYTEMYRVFRRSDDKFFEWNYVYSPHTYTHEDCDTEMREVFPVTRTVEVTTYE